MKQKRSVSIVVALVLIIGAVVVMSGCSGVNNKLAGIAYAGTYGGEGENHSSVGYWEFTVSASGNFTGWFEILSSAKSECSGSVKACYFTHTMTIHTLIYKFYNSILSINLRVYTLKFPCT